MKKMENRHAGLSLRGHVLDLLGIVLGSGIDAAATAFFITGCQMIPGGVTGAATVINRLLDFPLGGAVFIISGLIVLAGLFFLGRESFAKTLFCIAAYSGSLELFSRVLPPFSGNAWLSAALGGLFIGLGLSLILRCRGSLGTTDLIAQILNKRFGVSVSGAILVMDVIPMVVGAVLFGAKTLPYSVLCLLVITRVIALAQPRPAQATAQEPSNPA